MPCVLAWSSSTNSAKPTPLSKHNIELLSARLKEAREIPGAGVLTLDRRGLPREVEQFFALNLRSHSTPSSPSSAQREGPRPASPWPHRRAPGHVRIESSRR